MEEICNYSSGCSKTKVRPSLDRPSTLSPVLPAPDKAVSTTDFTAPIGIIQQGIQGQNFPRQGLEERSMPNERNQRAGFQKDLEILRQFCFDFCKEANTELQGM